MHITEMTPEDPRKKRDSFSKRAHMQIVRSLEKNSLVCTQGGGPAGKGPKCLVFYSLWRKMFFTIT